MRMDKLTSQFQRPLADAQSLAVGRDHQFIEPAHLMLALLDQQGGGVRPLLDKAGANVNQLRSQLRRSRSTGCRRSRARRGEVHVSNDLTRLLNVTDKLAQQRGDQYISSELFVLAAFEDTGALGAGPQGRRRREGRRSRRPSTRCAAARRSTTPTPRRAARRSRSTPST